ncbi:hypothetical protein IM793_18740 [Pedobacter sp. MR2016-19]|uniref:dual OB domain-containing protein n=1 Tax=Pedobacter sp. MR2016-19 TaxID=2780089 RepID=UPI001875C207|nr:hypothetical protein [Pedobacter sp. MR2016-19]MBE5321208.1 hypothetical protein [Pedobacter sp. MR2016-19]
MQVLILSKTKYGSHVCVGAMELGSNKYLRLLNANGYYQDADTPLNVGDIWDITYMVSRSIRKPHNEDVMVQTQIIVQKINNLAEYIKNLSVPIWRGSIENTFYGKLEWTSWGKGYISNENSDIDHSVGFWLSDKPLTLQGDYYLYETNAFVHRQIKYKGIPEPKLIIPANTLVRLSLAKWWKQDDDTEERCYMQLSGWYES